MATNFWRYLKSGWKVEQSHKRQLTTTPSPPRKRGRSSDPGSPAPEEVDDMTAHAGNSVHKASSDNGNLPLSSDPGSPAPEEVDDMTANTGNFVHQASSGNGNLPLSSDPGSPAPEEVGDMTANAGNFVHQASSGNLLLSSGPTGPSTGALAQYNIPISPGYYSTNFKEIDEIGEGAYGIVYSCVNNVDGHTYAIKKIPFTSADYEKMKREVQLMSKLDHPHVIRYYHCWIEPFEAASDPDFPTHELNVPTHELNIAYIVMEQCDETLQSRIEKGMDVMTALSFGVQLFEGLKHLHANSIIHRDIYPRNLFISSGHLKIADLGLAIDAGQSGSIETSRVGQKDYIAPEVEAGNIIDDKSDVFSCGMVVYAMLCPGQKVQERKELLLKYWKREKTNIDPILDLLKPLLKKTPRRRPSADKVIERQIFETYVNVPKLEEAKIWWLANI